MILKTSNLIIGYRNKTLISGLNLVLQKGELTCLLGPNGAGKSTLLHTLTGVLKPCGGQVFIGQKPITNYQPQDMAKLVSMVLSQKLTPVSLSVYETVALGRTPYTNWLGHLSKLDKRAVDEAMELVNIKSFSARLITELSDGEKQRVMIAKALAQDTPLMVLDEPTAHLDVNNRVELLSLLKELARQTKKSILLSTHELEMALQLADAIWLINAERNLISGTPEDLVIQGSIGATFQGSKVRFDEYSGSFKIIHHGHKEIGINGNGLVGEWTKKALQKEGYKTVSSEVPLVQIYIDDTAGSRWLLKTSETTKSINSIGHLKNELKNLKI